MPVHNPQPMTPGAKIIACAFIHGRIVQIDTERGFLLALHDKNPEEPLSPIYIELRLETHLNKPGKMTGKLLEKIAAELCDLLKEREIRFDALTGIPNAGSPIADALATAIEKKWGEKYPVICLKKKGKTADGKRAGFYISDIAGLTEGSKVLLVDDLITAAGSKLDAIETLEKAGMSVQDIVLVIDREQGGRNILEKSGYKVCSLFSLIDLLSFWQKEEGLITVEQQNVILHYRMRCLKKVAA